MKPVKLPMRLPILPEEVLKHDPILGGKVQKNLKKKKGK